MDIDPDAENDSAMGLECLDSNEDAYAVLGVHFEQFLCQNWQNFTPHCGQN